MNATLFQIVGYALVFISGTFIGSFLNVVVDRLQNGENILWGRSHCDKCKTSLVVEDLVPLLSFISLKGKCRYCKTKLSWFYPATEVLTGLLYLGVAFLLQIFKAPYPALWLIFAYLVLIGSFYIVIFFSDIKFRIIPNKIVFPAIISVLLFNIGNIIYTSVSSYNYLKNDPFGKYLLEAGYWHTQVTRLVTQFGVTLVSALALMLFFWFLILITKGRGMGFGDVKLAFLIGIFNGFPTNIVGIFCGFVLGAAYGIILMLLKKKKVKDTIAFGPFLIAGSIIGFLFGSQLLSWYMALL
jgi:leader peptidase (prepilin peptidase)/N-methyltransferase